jgi:hypothetical protein
VPRATPSRFIVPPALIDEVGVGDERLGVDGALGHDEAVELGALLGDARQHDGLRAAQACRTSAKTSFSKR